MFLAIAVALAMVALTFTFYLRPQDLPQEAGASPWKHLEGRKASIYENLRDLQFEYRVGKLSDADYQRTKLGLQGELSKVLAEIDHMKAEYAALPPATTPAGKKKASAAKPLAAAVSAAVAAPAEFTCPSCNAHFDKALKFCGECGKPMGESA